MAALVEIDWRQKCDGVLIAQQVQRCIGKHLAAELLDEIPVFVVQWQFSGDTCV
jgi:hypothetical protein